MVSIALGHDLLPQTTPDHYTSALSTTSPTPTVSSNADTLDQLPIELLLEILEAAIYSSPTLVMPLLLVCKGITPLVEAIIYRCITLSSPEAVTALYNTTQTKPHFFFQAVVKEITVTCAPSQCQIPQLQALVNICSGIHKLALPSIKPTRHFFSACFGSSPQHLTLETWNEDPKNPFEPTCSPISDMWQNLTYLRIRQPSNTWCRPIHVLQQLGGVPKLTHLHLVRRIHANESNDALFVEDVVEILGERPTLEELVVAVCPSMSLASEPDVENTNIMRLLRPICDVDRRLVVQHVTRD